MKRMLVIVITFILLLFSSKEAMASEIIPESYHLNGQLIVGSDTLSTTDIHGNVHVWNGYELTEAFKNECGDLLNKYGFQLGVKVQVLTNGTLSLSDDVPFIIARNHFNGSKFCYDNVSNMTLTPTEIQPYINKTEMDINSVNLPYKVKGYLMNENWHIYLTNDVLYIHDMEVAGYTSFIEKSVYVRTSDSNWDANEILYHELGHIVYYTLIPAFDSNYLKELNNITFHGTAEASKYVKFYEMESIAQMFYEYMYYPEELMIQAPNLYKMYENALR